MKSETAKRLQQAFNERLDADFALKYIPKTLFASYTKCLNQLQMVLERDISDYSLEMVSDLVDTETPQLIKAFWFGKGLNEYFCCVDGAGFIRGIDRKLPSRLLKQISSALDKVEW
jgi:hypothetical protein